MRSNPQLSKVLLKIAVAVAGGAIIFSIVIGLATFGFRAIYSGRIFPGIYLGWVNLSGQTPTDAVELMRENFNFPEEGEIILQYDDLSWQTSPAELGMFFSPNFNAELAFNAGREGWIT
ncbi:MAG: hypothetical protein HQ574_07490, partial [Chloroflexi bacterium]|nr:hypothetical protein [Chloroflexota bacterium]